MTADPRAPGRARIILLAGFAVFLLLMGALVAPSFFAPEVRTFRPTPPAAAQAPGTRSPAGDTVTIDAGDEHRWRFFDLEGGRAVAAPDTAGWDLAFRRFHVVPRGEIADLGTVAFEGVTRAPAAGYVASRFARDTANLATDRWYRYSYFSHLLAPRGNVYVVRTRGGRPAKLEILSYYCPGPTPGCVTFRYALLPP